MSSFYPIHLNIEGKKCLVVGGGRVAERKVNLLVRYGGKVVVVSPKTTEKIKTLSENKKIIWYKRIYRLSDLHKAFLVFCATNSKKINREIGKEAKERGIMVNVVDSPEDCDFISPSLIERGHLKVSISTEGLAPLLSKRLRKELGKRFGMEYRQYTTLIAKVRNIIIKSKSLSDQSKRKKIKQLLSLDLIDQLKNGEKVHYKDVLRHLGIAG